MGISLLCFGGGERMLLIPPSAWEKLQPLLEMAPSVKVEQGDSLFPGFQVLDEVIPIQFEFVQSDEKDYQLDVLGLKNIMVMDAYGIVLSEGNLLKLPRDQLT